MIPPPITNTSNLKRSRYFTLAYIFCCAVFVDFSKPFLDPICRKASLVSVSYKERPQRLANLSPTCRLPHQLNHSPCVQAHGTTLEGAEHISKQFNQPRFTTIHSDHYTSRQVQPLLLDLVRNCLSKAVTARSGSASAQRGSLSCGRSTTCRGQTGKHFPNLSKLSSAKLFLSF